MMQYPGTETSVSGCSPEVGKTLTLKLTEKNQ